MSANDNPDDGADDGTSRATPRRADASCAAAVELVATGPADVGINRPATTSPIKNATVAARETVTTRNRRVIARPL